VVVSSKGPKAEDPIQIPYDIETVRGAVVSDGLWAALLPAILAALWCAVLGAYLVRRAKPGAWKTPSEPVWSQNADGAE
jgi:hypothetical protein